MADPDLYQLYKDLVVGNVISSEEFWANRCVVRKLQHETSDCSQ
jgi:transcription initiation factor TFIIH subunit 1